MSDCLYDNPELWEQARQKCLNKLKMKDILAIPQVASIVSEELLNKICDEYDNIKDEELQEEKSCSVEVVKRLYSLGNVTVSAKDKVEAINIVERAIESGELQMARVSWSEPVYEDMSFETTGNVDLIN